VAKLDRRGAGFLRALDN